MTVWGIKLSTTRFKGVGLRDMLPHAFPKSCLGNISGRHGAHYRGGVSHHAMMVLSCLGSNQTERLGPTLNPETLNLKPSNLEP